MDSKKLAAFVNPINYQNQLLFKLLTSDPKFSQSKSEYQFQMLVPNEDKAFVTWRKPVYHYVNMALQHKKLINFWNEINGHIRTHAMKSVTNYQFLGNGLINDISILKFNFQFASVFTVCFNILWNNNRNFRITKRTGSFIRKK